MSDYYLQFASDGNSYVSVPSASALNPELQSFAVFVWGKKPHIEDVYSGDIIYKEATNPKGRWLLYVLSSPEQLDLYVIETMDVNSLIKEVAVDCVVPEEWTLFGFIINRTTKLLTLYLNGQPIGTPTDISTLVSITNTGVMRLGANRLANDLWSGSIDGVEVYKGAAAESIDPIAIFAAGVGRKIIGNESGLVWASNCDDGSGLTVTDLVSGNNGTIADAVKVTWIVGGVPFGVVPNVISNAVISNAVIN